MSDTPALRIRSAGAIDAPRIAALAEQLGYPIPLPTIHERLVRMDASAHAVGVAVRVRDGVLGWVETQIEEPLTSARRCRVSGLIVDLRERQQGIGRSLLVWAEAWARVHGCGEMYLTSNVHREEAHAFYTHLGWEHRKTSHVYAKQTGVRGGATA